MSREKLVPMMISISKDYRDRLRTMAAEKNWENPNEVISAAQIAREIISEHLETMSESS